MSPADSAPDRLNSWKEIAAYLDRQVRSVQRWEKEEGLPVHRLPHKKQGSVYAFKGELDAWRGRRPEFEAPSPVPVPAGPPLAVRGRVGWNAALVVGLVLLVVSGGGWWWHTRRITMAPFPAAPSLHWGRIFARATSEGASPRLVALGHHPDLVAITPDGATVAVSDPQDGTVSLVDTATEKVRATIGLGGSPDSLAMAPDGHTLYVGNMTASRLDIVDLAANTHRALATPGPVSDAVLMPDGRDLYMAMQYAGLERLDTQTLALAHLTTPACPAVLALGPGGKRLYIAFQCGGLGGSRGHDAIGVLDLASQSFVERIAGPPQVGTAIGVSPNGAELWSSLGDACSAPQYDHRGCKPFPGAGVNVFSLGEAKLIRTLTVGPAQIVRRISFFPDGAHAAIGDSSLDVVDTARLAVLERLPPGPSGSIALAPNGGRAYVPLAGSHALAIFDASPTDCAPSSDDLLGWWRGDGSAADAWGMEEGTMGGSSEMPRAERASPAANRSRASERPTGATQAKGGPATSDGAGFAPGRVGQAFAFGGHGSVSFGHDPHLDTGVGFGVAAWVKLAPTHASVPVLGKMSSSGLNRNGWVLMQLPDGRLSLCVGGGDHNGCAAGGRTVLTTPSPLVPGRWRHVAVGVLPDGNATLYLDGLRQASARLDLSHGEASEADLMIGTRQPGRASLRGLVDEVVLYGSAPAAASLQSLSRMPACLGIP